MTLLTITEVADILRASVRTVTRELEVGALRGSKTRAGWRIKPEDVDAYLVARENVKPVQRRTRRSA